MENLMLIWLAFNIVFGLWAARNWLVYFTAFFTGGRYTQNSLGRILTLLATTSCLAQYLISQN